MAQRVQRKNSSTAGEPKRGEPKTSGVPREVAEGKLATDELDSGRYVASLLERVMQSAESELLSNSVPLREQLLIDLANMQGEIGAKWFLRKWGSKLRLEMANDLTQVRDELRQIWQMDNAVRLNSCTWVVGGDESHYPPVLAANEVLNEWLSWRPSVEQERANQEARSEQKAQPQEELLEDIFSSVSTVESRHERSQWILPSGYVPFSSWLPTRSLVPDTRSLRPMLIQGVFEHWGYLRHCANSDCVTPYFIAKRKDQVVCNAEVCKAERQRQHVSKWWNEHRAKKNAEQSKASSKPTKKGKNVTRKAR
jgi:hypothetical protein